MEAASNLNTNPSPRQVSSEGQNTTEESTHLSPFEQLPPEMFSEICQYLSVYDMSKLLMLSKRCKEKVEGVLEWVEYSSSSIELIKKLSPSLKNNRGYYCHFVSKSGSSYSSASIILTAPPEVLAPQFLSYLKRMNTQLKSLNLKQTLNQVIPRHHRDDTGITKSSGDGKHFVVTTHLQLCVFTLQTDGSYHCTKIIEDDPADLSSTQTYFNLSSTQTYFNKSGNILAIYSPVSTAGERHLTITLWGFNGTDKWTELATINDHEPAYHCASLNPFINDTNAMLVHSQSGNNTIWCADDSNVWNTLSNMHNLGMAKKIVTSPFSNYAVIMEDKHINIFECDASGNWQRHHSNESHPFQGEIVACFHPQESCFVLYENGGKKVKLMAKDDTEKWHEAQIIGMEFTDRASTIHDIHFSADGKNLAIQIDNSVYFFKKEQTTNDWIITSSIDQVASFDLNASASLCRCTNSNKATESFLYKRHGNASNGEKENWEHITTLDPFLPLYSPASTRFSKDGDAIYHYPIPIETEDTQQRPISFVLLSLSNNGQWQKQHFECPSKITRLHESDNGTQLCIEGSSFVCVLEKDKKTGLWSESLLVNTGFQQVKKVFYFHHGNGFVLCDKRSIKVFTKNSRNEWIKRDEKTTSLDIESPAITPDGLRLATISGNTFNCWELEPHT